MTQVAILDYGMGNLHSVASAVQHVAPNANVVVTNDHGRVKDSDRVIFPGVGAIRDCMAEIRRLNIDTLVAEEIASGKPLLAVCIGMQALLSRSAENGGVDCLGHFQGQVHSFSEQPAFKSEQMAGLQNTLKVPHMGWNQVSQTMVHPLWFDIKNATRFYFVHSFFVALEQPQYRAGSTHYGLEFTAAVAKDNVFATQFHPEKSHDAGLQLLRNFTTWDGKA